MMTVQANNQQKQLQRRQLIVEGAIDESCAYASIALVMVIMTDNCFCWNLVVVISVVVTNIISRCWHCVANADVVQQSSCRNYFRAAVWRRLQTSSCFAQATETHFQQTECSFYGVYSLGVFFVVECFSGICGIS